MKPAGRVQYLLTSSACTYVSVKGSNSAVGTAVRKLFDRSYVDATFSYTILIHNRQCPHRERTGSWKFSCAQPMNRFRSVLLIPPMGLTSAINVRGTPSEQRIKGNPETDLKNNHIWSNNHASCAPIKRIKKGKQTTQRASARAPFVYVRAPQHEQPPSATANPRQELRKEVCYHHS